MVLRCTLILFISLEVVVLAAATVRAQQKQQQQLQQPDPTLSECAAQLGECNDSKNRPVCGTDDQTYPSRCHLLRLQCSGHPVGLKYRGPCKACKEARDYALKHKSKSPPKFIPRCKNDGTYAAIQCLTGTGCWCSDDGGKPIKNTSVRTGRPKCRGYSRTDTRPWPTRSHGPSHVRRLCTQQDRTTFNVNLIEVFKSEFLRSGFHQQSSSSSAADANNDADDALVIGWKFSALDVNGNKILDKTEFRELKKLIKRAVKPRRCGRVFGKFCDKDQNERLTRSEWNSCISRNGNSLVDQGTFNISFGLDGKHQHQHQQQTVPGSRHIPAASSDTFDNLSDEGDDGDDDNGQHLEYEDEADYDSDGPDDSAQRLLNFPSIYFLRPKPESPLKESDNESDCLSDQAAALEEQKHGGTILYVPECTADGRYQRVQCYRSTPYCWCVNEDTGKNIPGSSVKNKRPECDIVYTAMRPMKGCPEPRKTVFLKDLKEFFKSQILPNSSANVNVTQWSSEDDRIATLSFVLFDKNKSKLLERKEWKVFRELVIRSKTLRKCGKRMPRYCDVNSDRKITLSEWLNCMQIERPESVTSRTEETKNESMTARPLKLTGSNPLEQYLKD